MKNNNNKYDDRNVIELEITPESQAKALTNKHKQAISDYASDLSKMHKEGIIDIFDIDFMMDETTYQLLKEFSEDEQMQLALKMNVVNEETINIHAVGDATDFSTSKEFLSNVVFFHTDKALMNECANLVKDDEYLTCENCGADFIQVKNNNWYCHPCYKEVSI